MNCPKCGSDRVHSIGNDHVCLACESRILSPIPDDPRVLRAKVDALNLRVKVLEKALEEAAQTECAAICRKIRQDAQIADALVRLGGRSGLGEALRGLADEIERGEREQV